MLICTIRQEDPMPWWNKFHVFIPLLTSCAVVLSLARSFPGGVMRALVWQDRGPLDLNTLIPTGSPWYLTAASSINNAGQITGSGTINGEMHAFLATPTHPRGR